MESLFKTLKLWWNSALDFIFPRYCIVCNKRLALNETFVCCECFYNFPLIRNTSFTDNPIAQTFWGLLPIERATAFIQYVKTSPYTHILFHLKYNQQPEVARYMGCIMARHLLSQGFFKNIDLIIPVPLSKKKKRERGYNQSEWIAKGISETTGIPYSCSIVERSISNQSQTQLSESERRMSVKGIFKQEYRPGVLDGKHLLIVDDVMTTGATLLSCAESITADHSVRISILTLAYSHVT